MRREQLAAAVFGLAVLAVVTSPVWSFVLGRVTR